MKREHITIDGIDFTMHDIQIFHLLQQGNNFRWTAGKLGNSVNTLKHEITIIYHKLDIHSLQELMIWIGDHKKDLN